MLSEAEKRAKTNANKLACYYRNRDEYLSRQRERYHEKKAQKRAAERYVRFLEEARIELNAMYGFEVPRLAATTQISAISS